MKKVILFILSFSLLLAFPPYKPYFANLLSDNGKVTKNTLKAYDVDYDYIVYFKGEIILTGVLERADNDDPDFNYTALRFYPDNNIDLPFLYSLSRCLENKVLYKKNNSWDFSNVKFERLRFGVLLDDKNINLPTSLNKRILGASAVRAEITIKNYYFYSEGEAGREAYGKIVSFKALGDVQTKYFTRNTYNDGKVKYDELEYNSKDDYVNIRDKANRKIIGKILKSDMIDNKALLLSANGGGIDDLNYENFEKNGMKYFIFRQMLKMERMLFTALYMARK